MPVTGVTWWPGGRDSLACTHLFRIRLCACVRGRVWEGVPGCGDLVCFNKRSGASRGNVTGPVSRGSRSPFPPLPSYFSSFHCGQAPAGTGLPVASAGGTLPSERYPDRPALPAISVFLDAIVNKNDARGVTRIESHLQELR